MGCVTENPCMDNSGIVHTIFTSRWMCIHIIPYLNTSQENQGVTDLGIYDLRTLQINHHLYEPYLVVSGFAD